MKREIARLLKDAVLKAQGAGDLPPFELPPLIVEQPQQEEHGDYASNLALQIARQVELSPRQLAEVMAKYLPEAEFISRVEVAGPGFINFTLDDGWLAQQVESVLAQGPSYGRLDLGPGKRVQVEYGSANPTGPLHVGFARNVVLGDSLANLLDAAGYEVQREYYINDTGTQMRLFSETLYARYAQALGREEEIPEGGYRGRYMVEWGREIAEAEGTRYLRMPREEALEAIGEMGLSRVLEGVREDLGFLGIRYDNWFSERSLYEDGYFAEVMEILRQGGHIFEEEGATWFAASALGGDKDEVVVRSTGEPGYFASDMAYHYQKFIKRGFDWVIDVWGADHQGHVPRMKAMMRALGLDPERLTLLIYQLVTLKRGGEVLRLSKRTGEFVTLREVLDEVGPDAVRFFLLAHAADSQMDFDLELAKEQSQENPVYYVQYAHARIASILRYGGELDYSDGDVSLLTHEAELALLRQMVVLPDIVELAATNLAPHHLTYYAQDLASAFHSFYKQCRVVSSYPEDMPLNKARLKLVLACRIVLAQVLGLMGVSAPEKM
ncbi:MAG: arginine--tRNA ligase [Anaerolineae bacterium]